MLHFNIMTCIMRSAYLSSQVSVLRGKVSKSQTEIKIQVNVMAKISNLFFYYNIK